MQKSKQSATLLTHKYLQTCLINIHIKLEKNILFFTNAQLKEIMIANILDIYCQKLSINSLMYDTKVWFSFIWSFYNIYEENMKTYQEDCGNLN